MRANKFINHRLKNFHGWKEVHYQLRKNINQKLYINQWTMTQSVVVRQIKMVLVVYMYPLIITFPSSCSLVLGLVKLFPWDCFFLLQVHSQHLLLHLQYLLIIVYKKMCMNDTAPVYIQATSSESAASDLF